MGNLKIQLKPNERIYLNGAVVRVDRKVTIELVNDVVFLLESHVMKEEGATTPLRQIYFIIQAMLMEPARKAMALRVYTELNAKFSRECRSNAMSDGLREVQRLVELERPFDALKFIRALLPVEEEEDAARAAAGGGRKVLRPALA